MLPPAPAPRGALACNAIMMMQLLHMTSSVLILAILLQSVFALAIFRQASPVKMFGALDPEFSGDSNEVNSFLPQIAVVLKIAAVSFNETCRLSESRAPTLQSRRTSLRHCHPRGGLSFLVTAMLHRAPPSGRGSLPRCETCVAFLHSAWPSFASSPPSFPSIFPRKRLLR